MSKVKNVHLIILLMPEVCMYEANVLQNSSYRGDTILSSGDNSYFTITILRTVHILMKVMYYLKQQRITTVRKQLYSVLIVMLVYLVIYLDKTERSL